MTGVIMLWWSWGTWPDVLIDFGAQLYLAWQLAAGHITYGDFVYFKGPFSMYLNALVFRLFGVSLQTLVICNLLIMVVLIWLLYRLLQEISDRFSATIGCLIFVTIFAFGQLVGYGNYNFVCPYSHEVTHTVVLSLSALLCFLQYLKGDRAAAWLSGTGFCVGLVFLAEPIVFISVSLALILGIGLALWVQRAPFRRIWATGAVFLGFALLPVAITFLLFHLTLPIAQAARATLGAWAYVVKRSTYALIFYKWLMGTGEPSVNIGHMVTWLTWYAALFIPSAVLSFLPKRRRPFSTIMTIGLFGGVSGFLGSHPINWLESIRPLPIFLLIFGLVSVVGVIRRRQDARIWPRLLMRAVLALFSLGLLGRMLLNVHTYHYGFALAMPGTLLLVVALVGLWPASIISFGGDGRIFRAVALAVIAVGIAGHLEHNHLLFQHKVIQVSRGTDAFFADGRGVLVNAVLDDLSHRMSPNNTLMVIPEGPMINYLARRVIPLPYLSLTPVLFQRVGEGRILASFRDHPPDYIVLAHKDTSEEGYQFFGRDYAQNLFAWINSHYQAIRLFGAVPLQDGRFGLLLLQHIAVKPD